MEPSCKRNRLSSCSVTDFFSSTSATSASYNNKSETNKDDDEEDCKGVSCTSWIILYFLK